MLSEISTPENNLPNIILYYKNKLEKTRRLIMNWNINKMYTKEFCEYWSTRLSLFHWRESRKEFDMSLYELINE